MKHFQKMPKTSFQTEQNSRSPSIMCKTSEVKSSNNISRFNISNYIKNEQTKEGKWLNNIHEKPLIQLMADEIDIKEFTPVACTELNCYERLKKLLSMQSGIKFGQKPQKKHERLLDHVVLMQNQINKLEQKYKDISIKKHQSSKTIKSCFSSKKTSFMQKNSQNTSLNVTQKSLIFGETAKLKRKAITPNQNIELKMTVRQQMAEIKAGCYQKFVNHKKASKQRVISDLHDFIDSKLQRKIQEIINCKLKQFYSTQQENNKCKMLLLEKQLEIEVLRKELKGKEEKIIATEKMQQPEQQMIIYRKNVQMFYDEYQNLFGSVSLIELKKKIDFMEDLYINKYSHEETKYLELFSRLNKEKEDLAKQLNNKIAEHQQHEKELNNVINRRRKYEELDNSYQTHEIFHKIPEYKMKCTELQSLQKYIFNKYIDWSSRKNEGQTKITQIINNNTVQNYQQMIQAMIEFDKNFSSQSKNIEYTAKLCSTIQKIKKIIAPGKCHEKLQPFKTLEEIQTYLINSKRIKQRRAKTINRGRQYLQYNQHQN